MYHPCIFKNVDDNEKGCYHVLTNMMNNLEYDRIKMVRVPQFYSKEWFQERN